MQFNQFYKMTRPLLISAALLLFLSVNLSHAQEENSFPQLIPSFPALNQPAYMAKTLLPAPNEESFPLIIDLTGTSGDTQIDLFWQVTLSEVKNPKITAQNKNAKPITEEDIAGFMLFYGTESGNGNNKIDIGKVFKYRLRGLDNYKKYFITLRAYTKAKEFSDFSNEISITPQPAEELSSDVEKLISGQTSPAIFKELKQFGYDIFHKSVPSFAPVNDVPVGQDYVIGPGDSFTINLWGKLEMVFPAEVSRDGEITLPKAGVIKVWGLTLAQLHKVVQNQLQQYYPDFQMNITMNKMRTIRIFVVGEVTTPGSYSLSSLSTMINALFACGGPTKNGSLRQIQLIRNGKTVNTLDLYNFLLKGDKSQDARLEPGDTIFIPVIGKVAGVAGNVKRPAIYEMPDGLTIGQLLELSGGVTPSGYLQQVQIERVLAHEKRVVLDVNLAKEASQLDTPLHDGDLVKIYPVTPLTDAPNILLTKNSVYLEGHVMRPGGYELKTGMKISDLLPSFESILPEPHLDYAELIRLEEPDLHERIIPFNLGEMLQKDTQENLKLQRYDRVKIYSKTDFKNRYTVSVYGEVMRQGDFLIFENMRVKDLIEKAGGFKDSAYLQQAELSRQLVSNDGITLKRYEINLEKVMIGDEGNNLVLQKYDILKVRPLPEWREVETVTVRGEIRFPGRYTLEKGERLSSLIKRAGGYTDRAYLRGGLFTRESVKEKQRQRMNELIERQEQELQSTSALMMKGSLSKEDLASAQQSLSVQKELLKKLQSAKVTGRVVVKLTPLTEFTGCEYDMQLEGEDELNIPIKPGTVDVLGEVYNPTALLYSENKAVDDYLIKVGGPTDMAEEDEIYLILADGSVVSRKQSSSWKIAWDDKNNRWTSGGFMNTVLEPGDTILVPRKLEKIQWLKTTSEITQILYQIAVTAGITLAAF
ncbi:MAG: SLBB domain-containing protein [Candidatus Schekmanbacteria bacterium]|nr:SLBB domain-containing protein [Candidatus Schekmanbacteria bacterium]